MGRDELLEITMAARALGNSGTDPERAMERAVRAHRDPRFVGLVAARERDLATHLERAPLEVLRRARRAGLRAHRDEVVQCLARVEVVRELLGPEDHIDALGAPSTEVP